MLGFNIPIHSHSHSRSHNPIVATSITHGWGFVLGAGPIRHLLQGTRPEAVLEQADNT